MTVIVGAGLAGLTCAKVLAEAGHPFVLCEAAEGPGGRVASDENSEGYILDRGFQVLLDSYPAARRHLDLDRLGGGRFRAGALFVGQGKPRPLENPLRNPLSVVASLQAILLSLPDQLRLVRLLGQALRGLSSVDETTEALLYRQGFSENFFRCFARPFFGGVLLDPSLQVSAKLFLNYLRQFFRGRAFLPSDGMRALPAQLAHSLPSSSLRYGAAVREILYCGTAVRGVVLQDGQFLPSDVLVLATDEPAACRLLGKGSPRLAEATAVHYFSADRAFYQGGWLCLPPRVEANPVLHAALVTNVAPAMAPPGKHLWSVTVLPDHPQASDANRVANEVASWFGARAEELRPLDFIRVAYAVPRQPPGSQNDPPAWGRLPGGVLVAGDAVAGASIDAAMTSGEVAAEKVISSQAAT